MKKLNETIAQAMTEGMGAALTSALTKLAEQANKEIAEVNKAHEEHEQKLGGKIAEQTQEIADLKSVLANTDRENRSLVKQLENMTNAYKITQTNLEKEQERGLDLMKRNYRLYEQLKQASSTGTPTPSDTPTSATETTAVTLPTTPTASGGRLRHAKFNKILALVQHNVPVFMSGEAGVGKNVIAEQIAEAMGLPFYMSSKLNDEYGIRGYGNAEGKYVESPFYKAFSGGGVFLLDEMDASNSQALVALNTALSSDYYDFPVVGNVKKHPDFRVLANGNTNGNGATEDYNGREALDKSTLDRFAFMEVDYDINIETACAEGDKELVEFVHDCRKACKTMHSNVVLLSYRGISNFKMMQTINEFTLCEIMETTFLKGLDRDNIELLHNNLSKKSNRYAKVLNDCIWHLSQAA